MGQVLGTLQPLTHTHPLTTNRKWVSVSKRRSTSLQPKLQIVREGSAVGSHSPQSEAKNGNYRRHCYCFKIAFELGVVRQKENRRCELKRKKILVKEVKLRA